MGTVLPKYRQSSIAAWAKRSLPAFPLPTLVRPMCGRWAAMLALLALAVSDARADGVADFYRGKLIKVVVGFAPGGGYDVYARLLARHLGKYIRGNPGLVVQNMLGAGGLR